MNRRDSTKARDASYLRSLVLPTFADMHVGAITLFDVQEWASDLDADGYAPATIRKADQLPGRILNDAVNGGLIARSPCRDITLPKIEDTEKRFLTPEEITHLADTIDPRYRALVITAAYTGCRVGELIALDTDRYRPGKRIIRIDQSLAEVRGHASLYATMRIGSGPDSPSSSMFGFLSMAGIMLRSRVPAPAIAHAAIGKLHHMDDVDLGICGGQYFAGDPDRVAVLLPGARYLPAAPLLWFAREAAQTQGWSVLQVWDGWNRNVEAERWVADRLEAGLNYAGNASRVLLIAKSITSLALPTAVERGIPGVWLTPLLGRENVRDALQEAKVPTLAVGATGDPTWDSEFVSGLSHVEVIEIVGSNHSLQHATDVAKSIDYLRLVTNGITNFVGRLS